jgi:hypothetical protein
MWQRSANGLTRLGDVRLLKYLNDAFRSSLPTISCSRVASLTDLSDIPPTKRPAFLPAQFAGEA